MSVFTFVTDESSKEYCLDIAKDMCDIHGVTYDEAINLINQQWQGQAIVGKDCIYHDAPAVWAGRIFRRLKEGKGW